MGINQQNSLKDYGETEYFAYFYTLKELRIMIKICTGNTELVVKGGKTTVENIQEIILEMHMVNKLVFKHYSNLRITPPRTNLCCFFVQMVGLFLDNSYTLLNFVQGFAKPQL